MPTSPLNFIHQLRAAERGSSERTDGELLTCFLSERDEDALAALVERHAPMVWGVCCRVLRNRHDAEDAFQATILVLVRKATAVLPREMVGNWLYGVAQQTAVRLRATTAKRGVREIQMRIPEPEVTESREVEILSRLDQELSRLPKPLRALIVLCDLEGKTRKDVAQQLGCPEGTVASRLARGRTMLAKRLARQGLVVSGGALATALSQFAASASVPTAVVSTTITAANFYATGHVVGVISGPVAALTEGVLKSMFLKKILTTTVAALVLSLATVTVGTLSIGQAEGKPVKASKRPTVEKKPMENGDVFTARDKKREITTDMPKESAPKAKKDEDRTSLADSLKTLNEKASIDSVGKDQPPITEQEVIAAIRAADRPKESAVTDKLFDTFKQIAELKQLPPGVEFEAVGGVWDPGTSFVYDVWWVRIRLPKEADGTFSFVIRESLLRSRTLQEEVVRLEQDQGRPVGLVPGRVVDGGRQKKAIRQLKARIEKMNTK